MSKTEDTLLIIKPDAVTRGLIGEVLSRIERKGIKIKKLKLINMTLDQVQDLYQEHKGRNYYEGLIEFILSGPVVVAILTGISVINVTRKILGATNGAEAQMGTIRGDYTLSNSQNIAHGSDSLDSACREIKIFFGDDKA